MKLSNLLQNPLNRKIDRARVAKIKRAIKTSGVIKPLVYTEVMTDKGKENMLTDGHHRYVALKEMGYKDAPAVMSDERGIETAQNIDARQVKKLVALFRNALSKQRRVAVSVVGNPATNARLLRVEKHGSHDQSDHDPTRGGGETADTRESATIPYVRFNPQKHTKPKQSEMRPALNDSGRVFVGKKGEIHGDILSENEGQFNNEEALDGGFVDSKGRYYTREQLANLFLIGTSEDLRDIEEKVTKHGSHNQQDHDPTKGRAQPTTIKNIKNYLSTGTKVLLSAERSNLPPKQNAQRTATLRRELKTIGSDVKESDSKYGGSRERGFAVNISPNKLSSIKRLMDKYKQESVIIIQNGKAELRYNDGRKEYGNVNETTERVGANDNYSSIGGVKFTIPFKDRRTENRRKIDKNVTALRETLAKLNRLTTRKISELPSTNLALTREDLQDEMAHPHPGRIRKPKKKKEKGWTTPGSTGEFSLNQKMDMDEGVDTKHPYKNPEGAQVEGGRYSF